MGKSNPDNPRHGALAEKRLDETKGEGTAMALVPVESLIVPEGIDARRATDICALYLSGKFVDDIARDTHTALSTIYAIIRGCKTESGLSPYQLRHQIEKGHLADRQKAVLEHAQDVTLEAEDPKGVQKGGYGSRQLLEGWLDLTEGRKGSTTEFSEEETVKTSRKVKRG